MFCICRHSDVWNNSYALTLYYILGRVCYRQCIEQTIYGGQCHVLGLLKSNYIVPLGMELAVLVIIIGVSYIARVNKKDTF